MVLIDHNNLINKNGTKIAFCEITALLFVNIDVW